MHNDFRSKGPDVIVDNLGDPTDNPKYLNGSLTLDFKQEKAQEFTIKAQDFQWKDVLYNKIPLCNLFIVVNGYEYFAEKDVDPSGSSAKSR